MSLVAIDNQPVQSRPGGDATWLTDFVTPQNPDVELTYRELTKNMSHPEEGITSIWQYVAKLRYQNTISSNFSAGGKTFTQKDTWFYPSETLRIKTSNCANKTFLMTSLLKNMYPQDRKVYGVLGELKMGGIGGHAWVYIDMYGKPYFIETTQANMPSAFIPMDKATHYQPYLYFDDKSVFIAHAGVSAKDALNRHYGICAQPILENYLCYRCLSL